MAAGIALAMVGVWILVQVSAGGALQRLGVIH